jgi:hypothetical protein
LVLLRVDAQERSISIDADPILGYLGNMIGSSQVVPPLWQGPEGFNDAITIGRYRVEKDDWLRYRVSLHYSQAIDRIFVLQLDDDLQAIANSYLEDDIRTTSLAASFSMEREKRPGKRRLEGLLGRGMSLSVGREHTERSISNPIEAYIGDTLWAESGYSSSFMIYGYTGVQYSPVKDLTLSARINAGLFMEFTPESEVRVIVEEEGIAVVESFLTASSGGTWGFDFYMRPRIMLSIYF